VSTVAFHTLGCKVNHYESEAMMDLFKKAGYKVVNFKDIADVYIINSCTVTNEAARKSRQMVRRANRQNRNATVVLVGCYPQVSPEEAKEIEGVDLLLGSSRRKDIVNLVEELKHGGKKSDYIVNWKELKEFEDLSIDEVNETTRAFIKIEEGCNEFCTYCIIPYARGPVRSRKLPSIINEVKRLVSNGVKEIILTGTHLGEYGYDWNNKYALVELLEKLILIDNLGQIRLSSIEISEINSLLLNLIAEGNKICPHLHLPLQSGSDKILKAMNRPYTTKEYRSGIEKIRARIPDISITTDIIVGFPGELEKYYRESYNFTKEMSFSRLHVFPFSPRTGTPAAKMTGKIPGDLKKRYSKEMRDLNNKLMKKYQNLFVGKIRNMVVEEKRDYRTNLLVGVTDNYIRVLIDDDDRYKGKLLRIKLLKSYDHENAIGKIIK
jgi:threonylcarbamoyladenosine tRNA methylthiotransferase MtaB